MISNIRLQNFRSYLDQSFEFEDGVNIIVGPNASGKTNLLESILMLCVGKSFRTKDSDCVMFDKEWARIEAYNDEKEQALIIKKEQLSTKKQYIFGAKKYLKIPKASHYPVVIFEPNNLRLFHGSPENRREYFDDFIEQQQPGYSLHRRTYTRTLAQRNKAIKDLNSTKDQLFVWDLRLSDLGEIIARARMELIEEINKKISEVYSSISGSKDTLFVQYKSNSSLAQYGSSMLSQLEKNREADHIRGFTSAGPHRDDFMFSINGTSVSTSASRGETRTLVLALKIFELLSLEDLSGKKPILLLDDVFSELDGSRRAALTGYLKKTQSFITTTDADVLSHRLVKNAHTILVG